MNFRNSRFFLSIPYCPLHIVRCLLPVAFCLLHISTNAQETQRHKIAIFTPLYLDSAFDENNNFRYEKVGAKFTTPGLEFYYGVQLALDSLQKKDAPLEIFVYDSKAKESLRQQLSKPELNDVEMIIAQSNAAETKILAEAAQQKKIPFISATLPNDAGVYNNPYFVILNSTLQAHIEGIYQFLQKYHKQDKIIVFKKPGSQEDQIKNLFTEFSKSALSSPLNIKFVDVGTGFTLQSIAAHLDSTRKTVCIAGSMDENFGIKLTHILSGLNKTYPVTVVGMPTWDNLNFSKVSDLEIIYTNPFFYNRTNTLENQLASDFSNKMSIKPGDNFFRGYEATLRFALLLLDTKKDIASNLTRKGNTVITQFDIQPVFKDKATMTLDYFENKHLYFIQNFGNVKTIIY